MSMFDDFFQRAMGGERAAVPYPYQTRFATQATLPHLLRVPTSAGKTATALLGWLYRCPPRWNRGGSTRLTFAAGSPLSRLN